MTKRVFDIMLAFLGLGISAPVMVLIALLVKLDSSGPIFYRGKRTGLYGKQFWMLKFRTMVPNAQTTGVDSTPYDDPRLTRFGRILRKTKFDELPQLFNILKGEMSFVGPRPQVKWTTDLYKGEEQSILSVRPGLCDLAFLAIPNEGEILRGSKDPDGDYMKKIHPEKTRLQIEYIKHRSLWLDLKIIWKTIFLICTHVV